MCNVYILWKHTVNQIGGNISATETYERSLLTSASRTATTSAIVLRWTGLLFQLPLMTFQTLAKSTGWAGLLGRRQFNIE